MSAMASQITGVSIVCATVGSDQRNNQSSASLAFVRWTHRSPADSPHKGPVTREMFSFDDVIMTYAVTIISWNEKNDMNICCAFRIKAFDDAPWGWLNPHPPRYNQLINHYKHMSLTKFWYNQWFWQQLTKIAYWPEFIERSLWFMAEFMGTKIDVHWYSNLFWQHHCFI